MGRRGWRKEGSTDSSIALKCGERVPALGGGGRGGAGGSSLKNMFYLYR